MQATPLESLHALRISLGYQDGAGTKKAKTGTKPLRIQWRQHLNTEHQRLDFKCTSAI